MGALQGKLGMVCAIAAVVAGCGGSSSAERTKLVNELKAHTTGLPPDLGRCVDQRARALPLSQLRDLARAGASPGPATRQTAVRILTRCVQQGHGVSGLRALIVAKINAAPIPKMLPATFRECVNARVKAIPPNELSKIISAYATGGQATERAEGERFGYRMGLQCLGQPSVLTSLRTLFLAPIRRFAQTSRFSAAFRHCFLRKAEQISLSQLKQFALNPAGATARGVALGKRLANACIASGARP
jgi:hypothetical protein